MHRGGGKDRLSSLPDELLINILSRLDIDSAAATSGLSRRWRHLWTDVTNFSFNYLNSRLTSKEFTDIVGHILRQLTSPKLGVFKLWLEELCCLYNSDVATSCFREVYRRNVEHFIIQEDCRDDLFTVPPCLFDSNSLVILELRTELEIELPHNLPIQLPNLKSLTLDYLFEVPLCLERLIRSCPLLTNVHLVFNAYNCYETQPIVLYISAACLRSLTIELSAEYHTDKRPEIYIDAPKLEYFYSLNYTTYYYFIQKPMYLLKSSIYLIEDEGYGQAGEKDYLLQMSNFLGKISSVCELHLKLFGQTNIYRYLYSVNLRPLLLFPNLKRLSTTLSCIGCKDLLLSMQCFPNLEHLDVTLYMEDDIPIDHMDWFVPDCLMTKLKTVRIKGLNAIDDELMLLACILNCALVLEKLHVHSKKRSEQARLQDVCHFCTSLFKLPRASSTCEVVFQSFEYEKVSSNA